MNNNSSRGRRFSLWITLLLAGLGLVLAACAEQPILVVSMTPVAGEPAAQSPVATAVAAPLPPRNGADRQGGAGVFRPLASLSEAALCLRDGQPAYAVMQANANVRTEPAVKSCRLGRAPAGTLVRVEGIYRQGKDLPLLSLNQTQASSGLPTVGYVEDIQPIFANTCAVCHGDLIQNAELNVTTYESLMAGSKRGAVITPGKPEESFLWHQIASGVMPMAGALSRQDKQLIYDWIRDGAPESRPAPPANDSIWLRIGRADYSPAVNDCGQPDDSPNVFINSTLVRFASCAAAPAADQLAGYLPRSQGDGRGNVDKVLAGMVSRPFGLSALQAVKSITAQSTSKPTPAPASDAPRQTSSLPASMEIRVGPLGLPAPSDNDPWMVPQGGFCIEQRLQSTLEKKRGITSMAFAPDGRLFLGLDSPTTGEQDPLILYDAFQPSRSIAVYHSIQDDSFYEILTESSRITGMVWRDGVLYLNRAGEVGRIVDGGQYERLAAGFSVEGRLFHANNGIAISNGWLYISAGGVRDGFSDGLIAPGDGDVPAESLATSIAGGNAYGARIVRARLDRLVAERNIGVFQTAARGVRNPYGLTTDPQGRLWFTDNGATNVPGDFTAGDEVDFLDPNTLSSAVAAGDEAATPYYGFPMALAGIHKDWWTEPVLPLVNTAAPTGITWAYDTIFFAQYGRDPGLYRLANAGGRLIAERVLLDWPVQAMATAPDGALWIGTGGGGLYRLTPGCG